MDDCLRACYNKAMVLLARRDHFSAELRAKLQQRGFDESVVDAVLAQLTQAGVVDDIRHAADYLHSLIEQGYGPYYLQQALQKKGVSTEIAERFIGDCNDAIGQAMDNARAKRLRRDPATTALQMARFLEQRGFERSMIRETIGELI